MPRKRIDRRKAEFDLKVTEVFFRAMQDLPLISADTVFEYARRDLLPPQEVTSRMAGYFRRYRAAGYLKRTGRFITSTRNDSSALPLYASTICRTADSGQAGS